MALSHSPRIVTDGLVLCLDSGNTKSYVGSGTTWRDLSGRGNTGTLTNGPTYSSANGGSIVFDGTNDGVSLPTITPTGGVTFSAFIYINGNNLNFGSVFANWDDTGSKPYWIGTVNNNATSINVYFNGSLISAFTSLSYYTWIKMTVSHNGSVCNGYINGDLKFSSSSTLTTSSYVTSIGYDINRTNYPFKGNIAQAFIYNRALSAAEISQNFNALRGRFSI